MQEQDVQAFARMLQSDWINMVQRDGHVEMMTPGQSPATDELAPDAEPPCPACGTAAPLVDGACSDCGLHLA